MRRLPTAYAMLLSALASTAGAQTHADLARCRAIADDARRLECYDAIEPLGARTLSKYEVVPLDDFTAFALGYRGRFVELSGRMSLVGDYAMLALEAGDAESVPVEFKNLSRQELRAIREACPETCEATVQGRAAPVRFTTGVVADAVVVH
jgi:hypothetical protein